MRVAVGGLTAGYQVCLRSLVHGTEQRRLTSGGGSPGIEEIDPEVGSGVDSGDDKIRRRFQNMPNSHADAIRWCGMDDADFSEWFDQAAFNANRIFRIDRMALGTMTRRRSDDRDITKWQQCVVQSCEPGGVISIVVSDQKLHVEETFCDSLDSAT